MIRPVTWLLLAAIALSLVTGCANFRKTKADQANLEQDLVLVNLEVVNPDYPGELVVVVYAGGDDGTEVFDYSLQLSRETFTPLVARSRGSFFAYADLNGDLIYQDHEPYGVTRWERDPSALDDWDGSMAVTIASPGSGQANVPVVFIQHDSIDEISRLTNARVGEIATLDDDRFSSSVAKAGLWEPYRMFLEGNVGLYFLQPFDPGRIPVLFVHGISGTPREFGPLIDALDHERFQPWVLYYPSGHVLEKLGQGVHEVVRILQRRYGFEQMHLVAHSMGGLVSRSFIKRCGLDGDCSYLNTFVSIASPFGGVASAAWGVETAPTVVPVWNDLAPGSPFLESLFDHDLPESAAHYLVFAFNNSNLVSSTSSDGVIRLSSQLRPEAQAGAAQLRGFDETHTGVLKSPALHQYVNAVLESRSTHSR